LKFRRETLGTRGGHDISHIADWPVFQNRQLVSQATFPAQDFALSHFNPSLKYIFTDPKMQHYLRGQSADISVDLATRRNLAAVV
jgi:hypothetical protein